MTWPKHPHKHILKDSHTHTHKQKIPGPIPCFHMHSQHTHAKQRHSGVWQNRMQMQQTGGHLFSIQHGQESRENNDWRGGAQSRMAIANSDVIHHFVQRHLLKSHTEPCEPQNLSVKFPLPVQLSSENFKTFKIACLMYKVLHGLAPPPLNNYIKYRATSGSES